MESGIVPLREDTVENKGGLKSFRVGMRGSMNGDACIRLWNWGAWWKIRCDASMAISAWSRRRARWNKTGRSGFVVSRTEMANEPASHFRL
jgi:hypothetical protein